jgi:serralysin
MCQTCAAFSLPTSLMHGAYRASAGPQGFMAEPIAALGEGGAIAAAQSAAEAGTFSPTGNALADGLLAGVKWISPVLTYSFPSADEQFDGVADGVYDNGYVYENITTVSLAQSDAVADFTNLAFAEIDGVGQGEGSGLGDIRVTQGTLTPGVGGWAGFPENGNPDAGDVWLSDAPFNHQGAIWDVRDAVPGNYGWFVMIHELGHALGLKHGNEDQTAWNGFSALPAAMDGGEFSVMTYRAYVGQDPPSSRAEYWGFQQSWMMVDILALQRLYGANYGHNAGDTAYSWDPLMGQMSINGVGQIAPGSNKVFLTIWDGGGTDTYDMSNYADGVSIDLRPGKWSITSEEQRADRNFDESWNPTELAKGNVYNALLYRGNQASLIENAIGGEGRDAIRGNTADNLLKGGGGGDKLTGDAGADTLLGDAGDDVLVGGAGNDSLAGGAGNDVYVVDGFFADIVSEASGDGYDRVLSGWDWTLHDGFERLTLTGSLDAWGFGNAAANRLDGNAGDNLLDGDDGNDKLFGLAGADTLIGGGGGDLLDGGAGADVFCFLGIAERGDAIIRYMGAEDRIEVSAAGFGGGLTDGMDLDAEGRFAANTTGRAESARGIGQFIWETDAELLWWDADGMGGLGALRLAKLAGATGMEAGEIAVIA